MTRRGRKAPGQLSLDPVELEIRAAAEAHRQRQEEANEEFRVAWARKLAEAGPPPSFFASKRHLHQEDCWTPPYDLRSELTSWHTLRVRRCIHSNIIEEVRSERTPGSGPARGQHDS